MIESRPTLVRRVLAELEQEAAEGRRTVTEEGYIVFKTTEVAHVLRGEMTGREASAAITHLNLSAVIALKRDPLTRRFCGFKPGRLHKPGISRVGQGRNNGSTASATSPLRVRVSRTQRFLDEHGYPDAEKMAAIALGNPFVPEALKLYVAYREELNRTRELRAALGKVQKELRVLEAEHRRLKKDFAKATAHLAAPALVLHSND